EVRAAIGGKLVTTARGLDLGKVQDAVQAGQIAQVVDDLGRRAPADSSGDRAPLLELHFSALNQRATRKAGFLRGELGHAERAPGVTLVNPKLLGEFPAEDDRAVAHGGTTRLDREGVISANRSRTTTRHVARGVCPES